MRNVLALTMIVWISGIGHASANPASKPSRGSRLACSSAATETAC